MAGCEGMDITVGFYMGARIIATPLGRFLFRAKVSGLENLPETGPVILCCNHKSNFDPVVIGLYLKRQPRFMAKQELFRIPLFNWLIRALGAFPVRRGHGDIDAIKKAIRILRAGEMLAMFPEASRLREGELPAKFHSGAVLLAYKTKAAILPAAIICKGRERPFKKLAFRVGKPIPFEELGFTNGSYDELRGISEKVREKVVELITQDSAGN